MNIDNIVNFAKENKYEDVEYVGKWKDCNVYVAIQSYKEISYIGIPKYIIVKDKEIMFATGQENIDIFHNILGIE